MLDDRTSWRELPAYARELPPLQRAGCLVGIPYVPGEFDCGHLAVLAARLLFGSEVTLPGANPHPTDAREMGAVIALCRREAAVKVSTPAPGCVALFTESNAEGRVQWHLGTVVDASVQTWVLHTREGGASVLQRLSDMLQQGLALEGFYQWRRAGKVPPLAGGDDLALAYRLADRHAVMDIEACPRVYSDAEACSADAPWINCYAFIDPRKNSPEVAGLMLDSLRWAKRRGLVEPHPDKLRCPWLVRLSPGLTDELRNSEFGALTPA